MEILKGPVKHNHDLYTVFLNLYPGVFHSMSPKIIKNLTLSRRNNTWRLPQIDTWLDVSKRDHIREEKINRGNYQNTILN